jgi:hypothetical protein
MKIIRVNGLLIFFMISANFLFLACDRFGATGKLGGPLPDCVEDSLVPSEKKCLVKAGRFITSNLGSDITKWSNTTGSTDVSALIPSGLYSGSSIIFDEPNLVPGNIKPGVNIFGVVGYSLFKSNMLRDPSAPQRDQSQEAIGGTGAYTNDDTGYRAVPKIGKDNIFYADVVDRNNWDTCEPTGTVSGGTSPCKCGLSGSLSARISDCKEHSVIGAGATWDGAVKANAGQGVWKLVTRTDSIENSMGREVWLDERTQLLWSSLVSTNLNWCKASGSNQIAGNPAASDDPNNLCDLSITNSGYQAKSGPAVSACFEDGGLNFTSSDANIDNKGKGMLDLSSSPKVAWRLPTINDYMQADVDGLIHVLSDWNSINEKELSSTVQYKDIWVFDSAWEGHMKKIRRDSIGHFVRCVGR